MDLLNNLGGGLLKQQAVDQAVEFIFDQFNLPDSLKAPIKSTANKLSLDELGDLSGAFNALQEGKYQQAVSGLSNLLSSFPQEGALFWLRGLAKNEQNATEEARADLAQARELESSDLPDFSAISTLLK